VLPAHTPQVLAVTVLFAVAASVESVSQVSVFAIEFVVFAIAQHLWLHQKKHHTGYPTLPLAPDHKGFAEFVVFALAQHLWLHQKKHHTGYPPLPLAPDHKGFAGTV
jgi:hypothetical protein